MKKKRHSLDEVAAKLRQAVEMTAQGKKQRDIARTLGVSVMTYHRWRKAHAKRPDLRSAAAPPLAPDLSYETHVSEAERIRELQSENSRLRTLITDLLLEKLKLEDVLKARTG